MPDAEHTLYVVPDRSSEARRVDLIVRTHGVVRQIVRCLEFIVEKITNVVVKTIHQGITMIVPGVILDTESRYVVQLTTLKKSNRRIALRERALRNEGKKKVVPSKDRKMIMPRKKKQEIQYMYNLDYPAKQLFFS